MIAISQRLEVLREAGVIRGEIEWPSTCYRADREQLAALHQLVGVLLREAVTPSEGRCHDGT